VTDDAVRAALDEKHARARPRKRCQVSAVCARRRYGDSGSCQRDEDADRPEQPPRRPSGANDAGDEDRRHERELEDDPAAAPLTEPREVSQAR